MAGISDWRGANTTVVWQHRILKRQLGLIMRNTIWKKRARMKKVSNLRKGGICEASCGYNSKVEVYTNFEIKKSWDVKK